MPTGMAACAAFAMRCLGASELVGFCCVLVGDGPLSLGSQLLSIQWARHGRLLYSAVCTEAAFVLRIVVY